MRQICSLFMQLKSCMPARPTVDAVFSTDEEKGYFTIHTKGDKVQVDASILILQI